MLVFSKTNCSKPQKQKSSVFPPLWTLSNTFQTSVKRRPQKLNTKPKSPGKQRTSSLSERFFWHFNFRSLFRFYLIPPKTSRIFATFYPFQSNSTLFHPFQPFYVSLVNSHCMLRGKGKPPPGCIPKAAFFTQLNWYRICAGCKSLQQDSAYW